MKHRGCQSQERGTETSWVEMKSAKIMVGGEKGEGETYREGERGGAHRERDRQKERERVSERERGRQTLTYLTEYANIPFQWGNKRLT